jgi:hypothetical protein
MAQEYISENKDVSTSGSGRLTTLIRLALCVLSAAWCVEDGNGAALPGVTVMASYVETNQGRNALTDGV